MTINVTPEPLFAPPRNTVALSVPSGAIMDSVSVWRSLAGVRTPLRAQPAAGFTSRTVYDYEPPYGVPVTYGWSSEYIDSSVVTQLWTELWASLAAWTTSGASWSVSGGKLVWTGGDSVTASVTRAVTSGQYRLLLAAVPVGISRIDFGGFYIDVAGSRLVAGSQVTPFAPGTTTWDLNVTASTVSLVTSAGSFSVPNSAPVTQVSFVGAVAAVAFSLQFANAAGPGNGQTDFPQSVAVDSAGYIYVADTGNNRIQKFTSAGVYVTQWGTAGSGNGQFSGIRQIAFDSSNNLFVVDSGNSRIQKFAPPGVPTNPHTYSTKWGTAGTGDGQFSGMSGIAVDSAGSVYATDSSILPNSARIQKFTNAGVFTSKFGSYGAGNGQFFRPVALAVDSAGYIYVVDNALHRVQKFSSAFAYVTQWGSQGADNGKFNAPTGIAVDSNGTVYVAEDAGRRIQKFASTGALTAPAYASQFGSYGTGAGQFQNPRAVTVSGTSIFVVDVLNGVQKFTQGKASIDDVTLSSYGQRITVEEISAQVTLTPAAGWLVHPAQPALSFPLAKNGGAAGIRSIGAIGNASKATVHEILGSSTPVTTTNGNRAADVTGMVVAIDTHAEEMALKQLLEDETPILVNLPPSLGALFDYGFYQVGDTTRERLAQLPDFALRDYVLPLTQVQSPLVTQQNAGWSWAALAVAFPTWDAVAAAYETWADVATDTRRPGF